MLENVEIGEQGQSEDAYRAAKKKTGQYEDLFEDGTGSQKTILPQYGDQADDEFCKRLHSGCTRRAFEYLNSVVKTASESYNPDEILPLKKPKKKKSMRKREKIDLDALEAEAIFTGLRFGDLGSREDSKRVSAMEEEAKTEFEMRSIANQVALAKAEEASIVLHPGQIVTVKTLKEDDMVFGEDYEDMGKSFEQIRRLPLKRQDEASASGPQAVALLAANNEKEGNQSITVGETPENNVVITEMKEFVLGLQLKKEDAFKDENVILKHLEHKMEVDVGGWKEIKERTNNEQLASEDKHVHPDEIIHEVAVGKGLSGPLKLLREDGTLKESIDWRSRNMDTKKCKLEGINDNDRPKDIHLERIDEFGRIMTPKEAYCMISHKFHGIMPGKKKQEKRMKHYQLDLKMNQTKASDTPLLAMEGMREVQVELNSPYIVLSGHVKPRQTSDPRSGYATLEKDRPGSLKLMLGDKKGKHSLGVKHPHPRKNPKA